MSQPSRLHNSPSSTNLQRFIQFRLNRVLEPIQEEELKESAADQLARLELEEQELEEAIYSAHEAAYLDQEAQEISAEGRTPHILLRTNQVRAPQISARADLEGNNNFFEEEFERRRLPSSRGGGRQRINLDVQFDNSDAESDLSDCWIPNVPGRQERSEVGKSSMTIPNCWSEILEKDNSAFLVQLKDYSPLTLLLVSRILNSLKDSELLQDLNIGSWEKGMMGGHLQRQREVVVLASVLEFAHFNLSLGMRDAEAMKKVKALVKLVPRVKELSKVFRKYKLGKKELLLYKIIFDLFERYYSVFGDPSQRKLRKALIPLATKVFTEIEEENLQYLNKHLRDLSKSYPKFVIFDSRQEYLDYYEGLNMQLENQFAGTAKQYKYLL